MSKLSGMIELPDTKLNIVRDGQFQQGSAQDVDYVLESPASTLGLNVNLVPMQNAVSSQRLFYSNRFFSQADPLIEPDEPLVQNMAPSGQSFDRIAGERVGAVFAPKSGTVRDYKKGMLEVEYDDGETQSIPVYRDLSLNRKNRYNQRPMFEKGQRFEADQPLVTSNFTNRQGTLALGRNTYVGLVPYLGYSMDDATVISESFADRLRSEHLLDFEADNDSDVDRSLNSFISVFPDEYSSKQLERMESYGVVKPGTVLERGDPIILGSTAVRVKDDDRLKGAFGRYLRNRRRNVSDTWDHDERGVVKDVARRKDGSYHVTVYTEKPAKEGDKIVARSGAKFTISRLIPDKEMPRDKDGRLFDMLANPLGIPSRQNPSFIYELLMGKVAERTGKPMILPGFNNIDEDWSRTVRRMLEENDVSEVDDVWDPIAGRYLENPVTTGNMHILKLQHQGAGKLSARGQGGYTQWEQPRKGGDEMGQSKRQSGLETIGLLSAGAYDYLRDGSTVRGQRNDEYWRAIRSGQTPGIPGRPFAWDRARAMMTGAGYMTRDMGAGKVRMGPVTDKDIDKYKAVELENSKLIDPKTGKGVTGGLFDESRAFNNGWAKISLDQPIPNPAFEAPILKLLDLRKQDLDNILAGKQDLNQHGTGPQALYKALKDIDVDKTWDEMMNMVKGGVKTKRPRAINVLNTLQGLKRNELEPKDLMITQVPVIPSRYRPFALQGDTFIPGDVNELYSDVFRLRNQGRALRDLFGEDGAPQHNLDMYRGVKALYGFGPTQNRKLQTKQVKGFLGQILGNSPKYSVFQRNLFSKAVDSSGRGVAGLDPTLGIDEVGIPEQMGWKLYGPYVQRRLVKSGMRPAEAIRHVSDQTARARAALEEELQARPGVLNRAPAWHKFNSTGAYFKLHQGKNIRINPLITTGHNADFDGDTFGVFVPSLPEAVDDVKSRLMPSRQIFSIRDTDKVVNLPKQDLLWGLWNAATTKSKRKHTFLNRADAIRAIQQGRVSLSDNVEIVEE
jgi:hypothetical protein